MLDDREQKISIGKNVLIIDPTSPEPNRGSFCYMPYLAKMGLQRTCQLSNVVLMEDFTLAKLDEVEKQEWDNIFVALWSYPQLDYCFYLYRALHGKPKFFGYYPLIENQGLPIVRLEDDEILYGMSEYPKNYKNFEHLLLSDCDQHIQGGKDIEVVPLFTSYGCNRKCSFCSAAVNCQHKRLSLSIEDVENMLCECFNSLKWNIHFTDEDFLYDTERAYRILKFATSLSDQWQFIALAHLHTLDRFVDFVNAGDPKVADKIWKCMRLFEVGLETASASVAKDMHKRGDSGVDKAISVWEKCPVPILWLTMTFFPGETIKSIRETGNFLAKCGLAKEQMTPRLVTNGTRAGLGQFYQFYHGTGMFFGELERIGRVFTHRPMRLVPSFVPNSFSNSEFVRNAPDLCTEEMQFYMNIYGLHFDEYDLKKLNRIIGDEPICANQVRDFFYTKSTMPWFDPTLLTDIYICIALLARLDLIREV